MTTSRWDVLIAATLCAGLGIASGYYAAGSSGQTTAPPAAPDPADPVHLSDETLNNLGVEFGPLASTSTSRTRSIVATVVDSARVNQPLQAPVGGVIAEVLADPGQVVSAGTPIVRMIRAPIALPNLELTAEMVAPSHEEVHASIRQLREANAEIEITEAELERIGRFTGEGEEAPILPLQRRIDLEYAIQRARVSAEVAHHELERNGFSHEQMDAVAAGQHVQLFDAQHVKRALLHAGHWTGNADRVLDALPAAVAQLPITVGAIAELVVKGRAGEGLCTLLEESPAAGERFLEIASLLLDGSGLDDVRRLLDLGALAPTIEVCPPERAPDWDLVELYARAGDHVATGAPLVLLRDSRSMRLRLDPVGGELADVEAAIAAGRTCRAVPLVPGSGPPLDDVRIDYVATESSTNRIHGWARVENTVIASNATDQSPAFRSWALHSGQRYRVSVPTEVFDAVYELPRSAVTEDGPDRIVLAPTGDGSFEEIPIAILFEDEERVVLAADANPRLQPGQQIVVRGAFELGLAMHSGDIGADHGHSH